MDHSCNTAPRLHCQLSTTPTAPCPSSSANSIQSLDTVRSLHQTVVSLRNALDEAKREIENLKKQINIKSEIEEGKLFKDNDCADAADQRTVEDKSVAEEGQLSSRMASQIDVKIRVSSNIQMDTNNNKENQLDGQTNSINANTTSQTQPQKQDVIKIRVTSQENINISHQNDELKVSETTADHLSLEIPKEDNEDADSLSEGDNSVFGDVKDEPPKKNLSIPPKLNRSHSDHQEEVDDIELIFHSEENRDMLHEEDLVSISVYEPWQKTGGSGTPVLVSYEKLSSEQMDNFKHQDRQHRSDQTSKQCSIESTDSFGTKSSKTPSAYSTKESSLDKDNSVENCPKLQREDHVDLTGLKSFSQSKWTARKPPIETDISKCGIVEENFLEMGRRNTCPNPPIYRPIIHNPIGQGRIGVGYNRCPISAKYSRSGMRGPMPVSRSPRIAITNVPIAETSISDTMRMGPKRSSSVQTEISAVLNWQSESHLADNCYGNGLFTLPSKFAPIPSHRCSRFALRPSEKTQESRRILLSDINFTSMVPELSRSADHLCPDGEQQADGDGHPGDEHYNMAPSYCKGNLLQTPEMGMMRNLTNSASLNSQGSMNENSFGTQTTQTGDFWIQRGDSFDSTKSYSMDSRYSLSKETRSRSVPSMRCTYCRKNHGFSNLRTSESMHYTPRVTIQEPYSGGVQGSLPDLRHDCMCPRRYQNHSFVREFSGSTESLIDEAEDFLRKSATVISSDGAKLTKTVANRRCSENDIERNYIPSKQSLPFLPKSAKCLKPGHLVKVIAKNGRVVVGQVRYIGPVINPEWIAASEGEDSDTFIGLELANNLGDCDGSIDGKRFFHCENLHGIFVPFKKVIMAWTS